MRRSASLGMCLLVLVVSRAAAQAPTTQFESWGRTHVHTITLDDRPLAQADIGEFAPLATTLGKARIIALGEPFHGAAEPLAMRNRLIRYCVTKLGCTAVALETGLATSKRLYDYALGRTDETDSALSASFSYGFGRLKANIELLHWLREYNAAQPAGKKVGFYGIDVTGAIFDPAGYRSLQAVMAYLDHADTALAHQVRESLRDVVPVFRADTLPLLSSDEQNRVAARVGDLAPLLRIHRVALIAASSLDDYEWAERQAYEATLDLASMRAVSADVRRHMRANDWDSLPTAPPHFEDAFDQREASIASNIAWIASRIGPSGRVFVFAHDGHLQNQPVTTTTDRGLAHFISGYHPAGMYLRSQFGADLVTIGTYFGTGTGFRSPRPLNADGVEGLLSALKTSYLLDLKASAPPAAVLQWLNATRTANEGADLVLRATGEAYDLLMYLDHVSPARTG